jgi:hypothetical protein
MATAVINITSSGNNTVIPLGSNSGIAICQIVLQANALSTITFKDGSTALSGPMTFPVGGGLVVGDPNGLIWVTTGNFVLELALGIVTNVGGWVVYNYY